MTFKQNKIYDALDELEDFRGTMEEKCEELKNTWQSIQSLTENELDSALDGVENLGNDLRSLVEQWRLKAQEGFPAKLRGLEIRSNEIEEYEEARIEGYKIALEEAIEELCQTIGHE